MTPSPGAPEQKARAHIDAALIAAGWIVQDRDAMNLSASRGVAVREFKLTISGVEVQAEKYSTSLPSGLHPPVEPLPFL